MEEEERGQGRTQGENRCTEVEPHTQQHQHDKGNAAAFDLLFVGNFVQDVIHTTDADDGSVRVAHKLGGSVTYGPLAVATLNNGCRARVVCRVGKDVAADPFLSGLRAADTIDLSGVEWTNGVDTSYLLHYDKSGHRTLTLKEKGFSIPKELVMNHAGKPDAILFVPVAGEFDESLVVTVAKSLREKGCRPIIAIDIQGYLRDFDGDKVCTREANEMIHKLERLRGYLTFLKAEYGEAKAMLADEDHSPADCAIILQQRFNIPIVAVTLGKNGSFLATKALGVTFVPTYKPDRVMDETGCGDTYLACTIGELLHLRGQRQHAKPRLYSSDSALPSFSERDEWGSEVIDAARVGSAAASFLVQCVGPQGFATREQIEERIQKGEVQGKESSRKSVTAYIPAPSIRRRQSLDN